LSGLCKISIGIAGSIFGAGRLVVSTKGLSAFARIDPSFVCSIKCCILMFSITGYCTKQ
jgi:hypothetical protein